uniref:Uncharacterized protein n=1 Tax=Ditylenchus dipsaci TaxID=166011 RepID=A0A915CUS9_9BILA
MKLIWVPFILAIFISNLSECTGQATKLCADAQCSETLFKTACSRDYDSNHEGLLKCEKGKDVTVYAISFSNRPDLVEAQTEDAKRGMVYMSHLDIMPFCGASKHSEKVVGEKKANPHLLKLYEKYAKDLGIPVTTFEPIVSAEERQKASHSHGHGHSHGHSHEHPSEPTVSTEKVEPQAVSGVKVLADPTVAVLGNIKVSSNAQTNSEEAQQINTNSVAEEMQPVETISKTPDVLTKEADTQTNDAHYAAEAMPAASTTTPSIDEIPLEVAQANQTISNEIPSQQTLPVKLEQVSPPSDSAAKAAANVPPPSQPIVQPPVVSIPQKEPIVSQTQKQAPVTTISASVEQPPVTTIPDPVVQAQFEVPTTQFQWCKNSLQQQPLHYLQSWNNNQQ